MESFGDEDGAGGGEVGFARDISCSAKIGGNSNAFDDCCQSNELLGIGHGEGVGAGCDRCSTSRCQAGLEVENVAFLIMGYVLEFIVVHGREAGGYEVLLAPCGESFLVEVVLQMLKSQGVLEDVGIDVHCLSLRHSWQGRD